MLDLSQTQYLCAAHKPSQWPTDVGAEVAFVGRSNVGKSSAVNTITQRKGLAKTSKTPGRTQQLVFFSINEDQRLVDLPGYGFAKAPVSVRAHWEQVITQYLQHRFSLRGIMLPMDSRRPLTELDRQMLDWLVALNLPVHILLTKADKLSRGKAESTRLEVEKALALSYPSYTFASVQSFSALKQQGIEQARNTLTRWLADPDIEKRLV